MYGGLAAAMRYNDANAFKVFGLKNELDQQARQNAIQDKGLLWKQQDRATEAADRLRQQGIQDKGLLQQGTLFEQGQEDRKKKLADWAKAEGFHDVARELADTGTLSMEGVQKFNAQGNHKLIERSDAAMVDGQTGIVRLKWQDGSVTEKPMGDFLTGLGIAEAKPDAADDSNAVRRAETWKSMAEEAVKTLKEPMLDLADAQVRLDNLKSAPVKTGWFGSGGDKVAKYNQDVAAAEAKVKAISDGIAATKSKADEYRRNAEGELQRRQSRTGVGLTTYRRPEDLAAPDANGGGLLGPQAPYYLNAGPGGAPGTETPPVVTDPKQALAMLEKDIQERKAKAEAASVAANATAESNAEKAYQEARPDLTFPSTRGLIGDVMIPTADAEQIGRKMMASPEGSPIAVAHKAISLRAWNTAYPKMAMTRKQWDAFWPQYQTIYRKEGLPGIRKWLDSHR